MVCRCDIHVFAVALIHFWGAKMLVSIGPSIFFGGEKSGLRYGVTLDAAFVCDVSSTLGVMFVLFWVSD